MPMIRALTVRFYMVSPSIILVIVSLIGCSLKQSGNNISEVRYQVIKDFLLESKEDYVLNVKPQEYSPKGEDFEKYLSYLPYKHNPHMGSDINSLFTDEDFLSMKAQMQKLKKFNKYDVRRLQKLGIPYTERGTLDVQELPLIYRVTVPLISQNGKAALMYVEHDRGGSIGGGRIAIMSRVNGKWKLVSSIPVWVS